jgi:ribosome modulation factor
MRGAYAKGYKAAEAGLAPADCPYQDKRKDCGRLTWSRSFIAAWRDGFEAYKQQLITAYYQDTRRARSHT